MGQQGFWDFSERHQKLAAQKGFLVELDKLVPWDVFRPSLEADCLRHLYAASQGGNWQRKAWILENQMRS